MAYQQVAPNMQAAWELDRQRMEILQNEIRRLVSQKWRVVSQAQFSAQLEKQEITWWQILTFFILLLFLIVPAFIYALIVGKGKTYHLYLEVTPDLQVHWQKS